MLEDILILDNGKRRIEFCYDVYDQSFTVLSYHGINRKYVGLISAIYDKISWSTIDRIIALFRSLEG